MSEKHNNNETFKLIRSSDDPDSNKFLTEGRSDTIITVSLTKTFQMGEVQAYWQSELNNTLNQNNCNGRTCCETSPKYKWRCIS